jgi:hypothetical protein
LGTVEGTNLMRILPILLCAAMLPTLAACGGDEKSTDMETGATIVAGGGKMTLGVNSYLWHAALDTLSFMPLASADPFGGVIITDWYQPPGSPDERFKATAYILGRELRSDGVRLSIFRQVMQSGQWVDAQVSPATVGEIEGRVLARARELRTQSMASG